MYYANNANNNEPVCEKISRYVKGLVPGCVVETRFSINVYEVTVMKDLNWTQKHELERAIAKKFSHPEELIKVIA